MKVNDACSSPDEISKAGVLLICVDDHDVSEMDALWRCEGIHVVVARSYSHVVKVLETGPIALGILVSRMPDRRGQVLGKRIRASDVGRNLPLIFVDPDRSAVLAGSDGCMRAHRDVLSENVEPWMLIEKVRLLVEVDRQKRVLERSRLELEHAREFLVAQLTHDLRSPLAAIVMCVEKLSFDLRLNGRTFRTLGQLNTSVKRLTGVIERLPAFGELAADDVLGADACDASAAAPAPGFMSTRLGAGSESMR